MLGDERLAERLEERLAEIQSCVLVPTQDWTRDEWLEAIQYFPPTAPVAAVERWVALRRQWKATHPDG